MGTISPLVGVICLMLCLHRLIARGFLRMYGRDLEDPHESDSEEVAEAGNADGSRKAHKELRREHKEDILRQRQRDRRRQRRMREWLAQMTTLETLLIWRCVSQHLMYLHNFFFKNGNAARQVGLQWVERAHVNSLHGSSFPCLESIGHTHNWAVW